MCKVLCLSSVLQYTVKEKLPRLLEAFGAQAVPVGEYAPHSQVPSLFFSLVVQTL